MKKKTWTSVLLWVLAFLLTALAFVYQRMTGPTYPVRGKEILNGTEISYFLLRTYTTDKGDMPVRITAPDNNITAFLNYKRFKSNDEWTEVEMKRKGDMLMAEIPAQLPGGKVEYSIRVNIGNDNLILNKKRSVVARFKGKVPSVFLVLHIIFMFFTIMFALRTGMEALRKEGNYYWMVNWTLAITFIGGMILGPIVQKYAFGEFWTGIPRGIDLTDNKVLIAVIFWIIAFFLKKKSKWWVILAVSVMIVIYMIPHSVLGSELDYSTGKMRNVFSHNLIINQTSQYNC